MTTRTHGRATTAWTSRLAAETGRHHPASAGARRRTAARTRRHAAQLVFRPGARRGVHAHGAAVVHFENLC